MKMRLTKKQQLTEQLALEKAIRLGLCACLINLICEHARVVGGDQSKALADIETAMKNTASSLKVNAKDDAGDNVDVSDIIQHNVTKMVEQVFVDAKKRLLKSVH
jgi:hypothetical protein